MSKKGQKLGTLASATMAQKALREIVAATI